MNRRTRCGEAVRPHEMDELLEAIWTLREQGKEDQRSLLETRAVGNAETWLPQLVAAGLVRVEGDSVRLTREGEREGEQIIRRHRLTERLFKDVLETSEDVWEREACELEHQTVLTDEAIGAICTFLGHPPTCPHGRPIPRGPCCIEFRRNIAPLVIPLTDADVASDYRIVFMTPKGHRSLDRLAVFGVMPGRDIRIHQKRPSYVVRSGETDIALDAEVVREIFVKKIA